MGLQKAYTQRKLLTIVLYLEDIKKIEKNEKNIILTVYQDLF